MDLNNTILLKKILDNDLFALIITTPELNVLYCNPYFEKILEEPGRNIIHKNLADFIRPSYKLTEIRANLKQGDALHKQELVVRSKSKEKHVLVSAEKTQLIENQPAEQFIFYLIDITEHKKTYNELLQAQKMEGIGLLAGGIAHDFNNILGSISGYAELMKNFVTVPEAIDMISIIEHESNKAARLISSLLQYARGTKVNKTEFNISQVIQDTFMLLKKTLSHNIQFITEIEDSLPVVYGNPVEIQQSLINLCLNSKDAMPDGGELKIRVRRFQKKGEKNKKYLCLSIEDTGEGIPDDIKEKIFEPFFSTKDRITSSGLGLYMVQRIISEHGGWIEVKDNEPKGAIFELYLPAIEKELQDVKEEKEVEWIDGQQKLVLIIDDEESIVLLIRQFLERMNFRTLVAHNGMEAIDVFNQHEDDIDLILLDYMMPLMNGKEVYLKIREKNQNIPIMLFTGVDDEEMISEFVQMGVSSVIKKPFSAFDIIRKIKQVIEWKD